MHIPGILNNEADYASRNFSHENKEWTLSDKEYHKMCSKFGPPDIDMFASRINAKCEKFVSWLKQPGAWDVDAFTLDWGSLCKSHLLYLFPPFRLMGKVLQQLIAQKARALVVYPLRTAQPWYGRAQALQTGEVLTLQDIHLPEQPQVKHPLEIFSYYPWEVS